MGKELAIKGNGNGNGNTGVNHCLFFFIIFCVLFFSLLCVSFFHFLSCFLHGTVSIYVTLWCLRSILSQDVTHIGRGCYFLLCLIGIQTSLAMESVADA
jgi:hypothetical protein